MRTPSSRMVPGASFSQFESEEGRPGRYGRSGSVSLTPRVDLGFYGGYLGLQSHGGAPGSGARRASIASLSDSIVASEDVDGDPNATYIWGTNLTVSRVMSRFNAFIKGFEEEDTGEQKYMKLLIESRRRGEVSYNIDAQHIFAFDPTLYQWCVFLRAVTARVLSATRFDGLTRASRLVLPGLRSQDARVSGRDGPDLRLPVGPDYLRGGGCHRPRVVGRAPADARVQSEEHQGHQGP